MYLPSLPQYFLKILKYVYAIRHINNIVYMVNNGHLGSIFGLK